MHLRAERKLHGANGSVHLLLPIVVYPFHANEHRQRRTWRIALGNHQSVWERTTEWVSQLLLWSVPKKIDPSNIPIRYTIIDVHTLISRRIKLIAWFLQPDYKLEKMSGVVYFSKIADVSSGTMADGIGERRAVALKFQYRENVTLWYQENTVLEFWQLYGFFDK